MAGKFNFRTNSDLGYVSFRQGNEELIFNEREI
jgi:hypothetical protein